MTTRRNDVLPYFESTHVWPMLELELVHFLLFGMDSPS